MEVFFSSFNLKKLFGIIVKTSKAYLFAKTSCQLQKCESENLFE